MLVVCLCRLSRADRWNEIIYDHKNRRACSLAGMSQSVNVTGWLLVFL